jgi:hypothetical protein
MMCSLDSSAIRSTMIADWTSHRETAQHVSCYTGQTLQIDAVCTTNVNKPSTRV